MVKSVHLLWTGCNMVGFCRREKDANILPFLQPHIFLTFSYVRIFLLIHCVALFLLFVVVNGLFA